MLVKTNELSGVALDWAVAQCEGEKVLISNITAGGTVVGLELLWVGQYDDFGAIAYEPSTDWVVGGQIVEIEQIKLDPRKGMWEATIWNDACMQNPAYGPTILIAAMRCYVASKMGDTIEIPDELLNK